jgi:hypothetical protein
VDKVHDQVAITRREIHGTVDRLLPLCRRGLDVDLRFHNCFAFFRSEIFEGGLFLTFLDSRHIFPASVFFPKSSSVYKAYHEHHRYYQDFLPRDEERRFSLRELGKASEDAAKSELARLLSQ